ncbi:hypothetical protein [Rhodoferax sp. WC2427]|uniref:hypothetical protein n=1 Tax=Rhodoferax sp. WC2427 TaxID=3234144 RepID=UPI00346705D0
MEFTKFLTVVEDLAMNGGAITLDTALLELGEYIERLDITHADYEDSVVRLMRVAASIWQELRCTPKGV